MKTFAVDFLRAVVETLLPGLPATATLAALPAAVDLGVDQQLAIHLRDHAHRNQLAQVLQQISQQAGGEASFVVADETTRTTIVAAVEQADSARFHAFLLVVAADYYEQDAVLRAMGWYVDPPQPRGYPLPLWDENLLDPVRRRGKLWRG